MPLLPEISEIKRAFHHNRHIHTLSSGEEGDSEFVEPELDMAEENGNDNTLFRDFGNPGVYELTGGLQLPTTTSNFTIHPQYTRMVQADQFSGNLNEDPIAHLDRFLELCSMIQTSEVSQDYIRMHLFRQSLTGKAKTWLKHLRPNSLTS